mgnify:CR=1 FL=1
MSVIDDYGLTVEARERESEIIQCLCAPRSIRDYCLNCQDSGFYTMYDVITIQPMRGK